jgi:RNA polymerase sigma factor (sigma-70 family)
MERNIRRERLWRRFLVTRDEKTRAEIAESYEVIARATINKQLKSKVNFEDVLGYCNIALMNAIDRFSPSHGAKPDSWIISKLVFAVRDYERLVLNPRIVHDARKRREKGDESAKSAELADLEEFGSVLHPLSIESMIDDTWESKNTYEQDIIGDLELKGERKLLDALLMDIWPKSAEVMKCLVVYGMAEKQAAKALSLSEKDVRSLSAFGVVQIKAAIGNMPTSEARKLLGSIPEGI